MPGIYMEAELIGTSPVSFAEAVKAAVEEASKTVRHMDWLEVVEQHGRIHEERGRRVPLPVEQPAAIHRRDGFRRADGVEPAERAAEERREPEATAPAAFAATLPATRTLVVYAQGDVAALPAGVEAFPGEVLALAGGFDAWKAEVLAAPQPPADPTPALLAEFRTRSALNGYFTGAAASPPPKLVVKAVAPSAAPKKGGGC